MSLANPTGRAARPDAVPKGDQGEIPDGRCRESGPDGSAAESAKATEPNRPAAMLLDAAGAIVFSIGLVVLLMAIIGALHAR